MLLEPSLVDPRRYVIEPVQEADLRRVMRLAWHVTNHLYPGVFFEAVAKRERQHFQVVRDAATREVLGFLVAARQPGMKQNFLMLVVEPMLMGQGLRRALLAEMETILKHEGVREYAVEVQAGDEELLEFYRREGFEVVGVERAAPDVDHAVLGKHL